MDALELDPNLSGEMKVTVTLKAVSVGTEVNIEQQGVPDVIPAKACYLGWQESLRKLTKFVEPEIKQWRRRFRNGFGGTSRSLVDHDGIRDAKFPRRSTVRRG